MNYKDALERLEHFRDELDRYRAMGNTGTPEARELHRRLAELYGDIADVIELVLGRQEIKAPNAGWGTVTTYPNLIEAGYFSSRTIYQWEGWQQLLTVIG